MASFSSLMLSHHSCVVCLFSLADLLGYVQGISGTNQIKSSYCTCIIYKCRSVYCIHTIYVILYPWHLILSYASTNKNLDDLHSLSRNPMVYGFQKTFPQCIFRKVDVSPIDRPMYVHQLPGDLRFGRQLTQPISTARRSPQNELPDQCLQVMVKFLTNGWRINNHPI